MAIFAKGAEAELSDCAFLDRAAVCKTRTAKAYRPTALDEKIRAERTKTEARILSAAKTAGCATPVVLHVDLQEHEIYLQKINGELLQIKLPKLSARQQAAVLEDAGKQLARLHNAGIYHGDSTTSNVMLDVQGNVWWIDFGLADYSHSAEEHATDVILMKKSLEAAQFEWFWKGYASEINDAKLIQLQMLEIEARGRYVERAMFETKKKEVKRR